MYHIIFFIIFVCMWQYVILTEVHASFFLFSAGSMETFCHLIEPALYYSVPNILTSTFLNFQNFPIGTDLFGI